MVLVLGAMVGSSSLAGAMVIVLTDGVVAMLVLAAAGGYGWTVLRFFRPERSPTLLWLATAAALGLWMLSTSVLVVGSFTSGLLTMYFWWPVIGAGVILAAVQAYHPLKALKPRGRITYGSLIWVPVAIAAGMWLAGAVIPPGWLGNLTMDSYDVLEYHLQLPREYYHAGSVSTLRHNVYSHYPLGAEMLFLLGMCLRGGAYEGMYLAKLTVGLFGVVMVAGVFGGAGLGGTGLGGTGLKPVPRRTAAVLLATAPPVVYLSWLGMVEPAQFCYLALALVWLRRWLTRPSARESVIIGAMLGAACAVKYLSVGLIAGPVLAVMLVVCLARFRRRIAHVALAGGVCVLLFSPWLIRNTAATGNPVFPLVTGIFGQGHFCDESAARWRDGHAPGHHRPVPVPPDYREPTRRYSRSERIYAFLSGRKPYDTQPPLGAGVLLAGAMILVMLVRPVKAGLWNWAVLGVLVIQMLVWVFFTHDMPARFIFLSVVPISMLAADGLARFNMGTEHLIPLSFRKDRRSKEKGSRGIKCSVPILTVLLIAAAGSNLLLGLACYRAEIARWHGGDGSAAVPAGLPGRVFARELPYYAKANEADADILMLVGEARAFYFPAGAIYATVFDEHPLAGVIRRCESPDGIIAELRRMGVTHVFVSWAEIGRLTYSYGWPGEMRRERLREIFSDCRVIDEARGVFTLYALRRTSPVRVQPNAEEKSESGTHSIYHSICLE